MSFNRWLPARTRDSSYVDRNKHSRHSQIADDEAGQLMVDSADEPSPAYYALRMDNADARREALRCGPNGSLRPESDMQEIGRSAMPTRESAHGDGRLLYFEAALARAKSGGSNVSSARGTTGREPHSVNSVASSSPPLPPYRSGIDMNHPGLGFQAGGQIVRKYNNYTYNDPKDAAVDMSSHQPDERGYNEDEDGSHDSDRRGHSHEPFAGPLPSDWKLQGNVTTCCLSRWADGVAEKTPLDTKSPLLSVAEFSPSPTTQHFGPAPIGRVMRRTHNAAGHRRIKQTAKLDAHGFFAVDMPIPTRLAHFLPMKGVEEQKTTRFVTRRPWLFQHR